MPPPQSNCHIHSPSVQSPPLLLAGVLTVCLLVGQWLPAFRFFSDADHYLPYHVVLELISLTAAAMVATLAWFQSREDNSSHAAILSAGFLAVVAIDVAHTFSYKGMPDFITPSGPEKAINFWLIARFIAAVVILWLAAIPKVIWRRRHFHLCFLTSVVCILLVGWLGFFHIDWFPRTFEEGKGLTRFKVGFEYGLVAIYAVAALLFFQKARRAGETWQYWLAAAAWILGLAELFFTLYVDVTDIFNLLGHVYKAIAYLMILHAMFKATDVALVSYGKDPSQAKLHSLVGVSLTFFFVLGVSGFSLWQSRTNLMAKAQTSAETLTAAIEEFVYASVHGPEVVLRFAAATHRDWRARRVFQPSAFAAYLEGLKTHSPAIANIRHAERDGSVTHVASGCLPATARVDDRPYFIRAREGERDLIVSAPVLGKISHTWVLPLAVRLEGSSGQFDGVLNANLSLSHFSNMFAGLNLDQHSTVLVFDADTAITLRYPDTQAPGGVVGVKVGSPQFNALWTKGVRAATFRAQSTLDGVWRTYSYRQVGSYPLYVMVGLAETDVMAPWRAEVAVVTTFCIIMGILLSFMAAGHRKSLLDSARQESQLKDERRRLNDILEGTHVGTWEWNVQTGETVFNERWAGILGYQLAELAPVNIETWVNLCHPDDLQHSGKLLKQHFVGQLPYYECEARMRHKDGHWVWVLDRGKIASWTEAGEPLLMSGTHQDISERKQAEFERASHSSKLEKLVDERTADLQVAKEAAEAASRAKTAFLSVASHELRTPMNGVMGTIALAMKRTTDPTVLDYLGKADRASRQLLGIVNDVLDISRIESERLTLAQEPFSTAELRQHVLDALDSLAAAKQLPLLYQADPQLEARQFIGDPMRLTQILINLVGNAIKFTTQGQVAVTVREQPAKGAGSTCLRFEVRDTGIGIAKENLQRIFEPFEQAEYVMTRRHGGTGLGLTLCKRLVQAMQGEIGVESTLGRGSLFWFEVSLTHSDLATSSVQDAQQLGQTLLARHGGANILLVEDEPLNQEIVRAMLEEVGLNVYCAADGLEAVECAQAGRFDLILMDMNMPNKDGLEATYDIRGVAQHAHTPIIAMTANAFVEDREACLKAGMNDHIGKPVMPEVLYKTLLRWLGKNKPPEQ